jgi:prepilin-type N-terminal cleavage/methylation domain-containing protein
MKTKAFTLMELMVVVVIIGIIAGFALPQYQRSIRKAHERDALVQLTAIHASNTMYRAVNDTYWPGANQNLAQINAGLNLNILANDMTYTYTRATATTYTARAAWDETGVANDFVIQIDQTAIDNNNPCCVVGFTCPSLVSC